MKLATPDHGAASEAVPNYWVRSFLQSPLVSASQFDQALGDGGLTRLDLDPPGALVPLASEMAVIGSLTEQSDDPLFALRLGQSTTMRKGSIVSYILHCSPTLHQGLDNICQFSQITRPRSLVKLVETGEGVEFVIGHPDRAVQMAAFYREFVIGTILQTLNDATQSEIRLRKINLPLPGGNRLSLLSRALRCPLEGGTGHTGLVFGPSDLQRRIRASDEQLLDHLTQYGRVLLGQTPRQQETTTEQVYGYLTHRLTGEVPQIAEVAAALALSQRSLSRRLADEGTTFRAVVDEARFAVARALLDDPSLSLTEISYLLGYASLSGFTHAYKRWTGHAPTADRQAPAHQGPTQNK